jgi:hypothetical protein
VRHQKTSYIEYATAKDKPTIPCDVHGTGLRIYARDQEESEWPRPVFAVDLATIRPVAVGVPALVGLNDVYRSVKPAALRMRDDEIPVAKAEAVNQQVADAAAQVADQAAKPQPAVPVTTSQEVRRAESVKPLDVPSDAASIPLEAPAPIQF